MSRKTGHSVLCKVEKVKILSRVSFLISFHFYVQWDPKDIERDMPLREEVFRLTEIKARNYVVMWTCFLWCHLMCDILCETINSFYQQLFVLCTKTNRELFWKEAKKTQKLISSWNTLGFSSNYYTIGLHRWSKYHVTQTVPGKRAWQSSLLTVSFIWIWLILILHSLCLKESLNVNLSPSSTSRPWNTRKENTSCISSLHLLRADEASQKHSKEIKFEFWVVYGHLI